MHHEISLKVNDSSVLEAIYFGISGSARRKQVKFIFGASSHYLLPFVLLCENPHTLLSTSIFFVTNISLTLQPALRIYTLLAKSICI